MDRLDFREKRDAIVVFGFAVVIFALTGLNWHGLRQFSSVVSVVCFMILMWRVIGDWKKLTLLSLVLSVALSLNLGLSSVAQYLLAHPPAYGPPPPDNHVGISLVLISRLFVLFVVITWDFWLDAEKRDFRE